MEMITLAAPQPDGWQMILIGALAAGAALVLGYRIYRLSKGGPIADVYGGAALAALLVALALLIAADVGWARWPALGYALLFGLVVMPVWTLGVLLPLQPGRLDYGFTALYWLSLILTAVAAVAAF